MRISHLPSSSSAAKLLGCAQDWLFDSPTVRYSCFHCSAAI
jgi:hypothetical protein